MEKEIKLIKNKEAEALIESALERLHLGKRTNLAILSLETALKVIKPNLK